MDGGKIKAGAILNRHPELGGLQYTAQSFKTISELFASDFVLSCAGVVTYRFIAL